MNYWDWIILPGMKFKLEDITNVDQIEYAVERIKKDEDVFGKIV